MSVCPDNMYSVSICILYCRFGTSPLACGVAGSGLPQVAKFRDHLFIFISRAQLGVVDDGAAYDRAILVHVGLGTNSSRLMSI